MSYKLFSYNIFPVVSAAVLLAMMSCSENAGVTDIPQQSGEVEVSLEQVPLLFGMREKTTTRADLEYYVDHVADRTNIALGKQVGMFGYYQKDTTWVDWNDALRANFFYNEPMTSEGPTNVGDATANLRYSPVRFWPNGKDDMLAFFAYYPYTDATDTQGTGITVLQSQFQSGMYSRGAFHFVTQPNSIDQVDFMVSQLVADQHKADYIYKKENGVVVNDGRVPLLFYHALSRIIINIDFQSTTTYDKIEDISITGVKLEGDYYPKHIGDESAWTNQAYPDTVTIDTSLLPQTGDAGYPSMIHFDNDNETMRKAILLLIPQQCVLPTQADPTTGQKINLTFHKTDGSGSVTIPYGLTDKWLAGRDYIYTFTINDHGDVERTYFYGNAGKPTDGGTISN